MIDPKLVISPIDRLTNLHVIYDGGERQDGNPFSGWALAEFDWDEAPAIGIRWNGEGDTLGMPMAGHGKPGWFVLPESVGKSVQEGLYAHLYRGALAVAEVREAGVTQEYLDNQQASWAQAS
jgi:hypothetical protein